MKRLSYTILMMVGLLFYSQALLAQATTIPSTYPSLYRGVRPLGMGNAFLAMRGTDENAPFYNPAAINDYDKKLHMRVLSPVFDFSPSMIGLINDVRNLANTIDSRGNNNQSKINDFQTFVDNHTGEFESFDLRLPIFTIMHKYFFVSTLADTRNTFSFRNRAFTNIEFASRSDAGGLIGTAYSFLEDQLQAGVNLKILYRLAVEKTITAADIINTANFSDIIALNRSVGVGFDVGLKGKIPTFNQAWLEYMKPMAGFSWQDVGNTRFGGSVPNTEQSIGFGFAVHHDYGKWGVSLTNDFRELNQNSDFLKKWHIGAELASPRLAKFFSTSIRLGGNQGYLATGATFDFRFFKLEAAYYGEELGQLTTQKALKRLAANIAFGF